MYPGLGKRHKFLRIWLGIMTCCMILAGCGGKGVKDSSLEKNSKAGDSQVTAAKAAQTYEATYVPSEGAPDYRGVRYHGGFIYSNGITTIDRFDVNRMQSERFLSLKGETPKSEDGRELERRLIGSFDFTKDGNVLVLVRIYDLDENGYLAEIKGYVIEEYDVEGNLLSGRELEKGTEYFPTERSYSFDVRTDNEGNLLIMGDNSILMLSPAGKEIAWLPASREEGKAYSTLVRTSGGEIWIYRNSPPPGITKADFAKGTLEDLEEIPENNGYGLEGIGEGEDGEAFAYSYDKIFSYDAGKREWSVVLEWNSVGIKGRSVMGIAKLGENFVAYLNTGELAVIKPAAPGTPGREPIVLVTFQRNEKLEEITATYNRSQNRYLVKIVEYAPEAQNSGEYVNYVDRMMMDVLGDDPPDLINLSDFLLMYGLSPSWQDMLEKEYIEDLGPYLDRSETLSRDQFVEKILSLCTYDGKIAALPQSVHFDTLLVSTEDLGVRYGWSIEDMIAYDKAHPETELVDDCTDGKVFYLGFFNNVADFVDFEKKEVHFNVPAFRALMEHAASYPKGEATFRYPMTDKIIRMMEVQSILDVQSIPHVYYEGEAQIIGYPTADGTPFSGLRVAFDSTEMAICKRGRNKEGAWSFIEYLQQYDLMQYETYEREYGGIPARKETLERCMEDLCTEGGAQIFTDKFGTFPYHPLSEEERELFYRILDTSSGRDPRHQAIWNMVYAEAKTYFDGSKTLDEVIGVIESRVNLYLKEN